MKHYTRAISLSPKDGALYSNRSFAFLRLELPARALADADEAIRRRPDWPKGHFRRGEALRATGLHNEAFESYARGAALDPTDEHLRLQCEQSRARAAALKRNERMMVLAGAALGLLLFALLAFVPSSPAGDAAEQKRRAKAMEIGALGKVVASLSGAALGAAAGFGLVALRAHGRRGAVLPPLEPNDRFVAMQVLGQSTGQGLQSRSESSTMKSFAPAGSFSPMPNVAAPAHVSDGPPACAVSNSGASKPGVRHRSVKHGRAAALRAMGKET